MSGSLKLGLILIAIVVLGGIVVKIASSLLALLMPIAIVVAVGLILYSVINRKALGGGRRILP